MRDVSRAVTARVTGHKYDEVLETYVYAVDVRAHVRVFQDRQAINDHQAQTSAHENEGNDNTEHRWVVFRRYNDFAALHDTLNLHNATERSVRQITLPALPPKVDPVVCLSQCILYFLYFLYYIQFFPFVILLSFLRRSMILSYESISFLFIVSSFVSLF